MSLYDGLDVDGKPGLTKSNNSDLSGWGSSLKLLETQKQLQAKKSLLQNLKKKATAVSLAPVIDLKGRKNDESVAAASTASGSFRFNQLTGRMEHVRLSGGVVAMTAPFIGSDAPMGAGTFLGVTDEYDPLKPNDYETFVKMRKAERQKEKEAERSRLGDVDRSSKRDEMVRERRRRDAESDDDDDDDDDDRRRRSRRDDDRGRRNDDADSERRRRKRDDDDDDDDRASKRSGAAIAPPPSLLDLDIKPTEGFQSTLESGLSEDQPDVKTGSKFGLAGSVASKIMARMGYKEGQGLGKSEQGMSIALQVEKTSRRGGKIIHERDLLKGAQAAKEAENTGSPVLAKPIDSSNANLLRNPSKVVVLRNMVGPGEVDEDLEGETAEECSKFGKVIKCMIFEIPGVEPEEAVRIFLEFERMESATKALVDLNGRFFGGRVVRANFYNLDRFRRLDLGGNIE